MVTLSFDGVPRHTALVPPSALVGACGRLLGHGPRPGFVCTREAGHTGAHVAHCGTEHTEDRYWVAWDDVNE